MDQAASAPLDDVIVGGKAALARALARLEQAPEAPETLALLDAAYAAPRAHVIGVTGPPGVGKSTLLGALIAQWRAAERGVGVIAVDPSSRRSGGALLGDRLRLFTDPEDVRVFVRSMAARDRLGGLADMTPAAMVLMRAVYDVVLIETVGVGQSETDVAAVCDSVVLCVQPGSGDALQFMKAGIIEIPHVAVVTKADLGGVAGRAAADLRAALQDAGARDDWSVPVLLISAQQRVGIESLVEALQRHYLYLEEGGALDRLRRDQAGDWLREMLRHRFGSEGLARVGDLALAPGESPFRRAAELAARLRGREDR